MKTHLVQVPTEAFYLAKTWIDKARGLKNIAPIHPADVYCPAGPDDPTRGYEPIVVGPMTGRDLMLLDMEFSRAAGDIRDLSAKLGNTHFIPALRLAAEADAAHLAFSKQAFAVHRL